MSLVMPINFLKWIETNHDQLKPPVGNKVIYQGEDFIAMVVGGPNERSDYHVNQTEEFFYQIEGDMVLKVKIDNSFEDISIKSGEMFLLPANIPHSPQRAANTIGLVIERVRPKEMLDGFQWYCQQCGNKLYEDYLYVADIVKELPEIFQRFHSDPANKHCHQCHAETS